jgi:hypothetical protein
VSGVIFQVSALKVQSSGFHAWGMGQRAWGKGIENQGSGVKFCKSFNLLIPKFLNSQFLIYGDFQSEIEILQPELK